VLLLFKNSQPRQALDKFLELAVNGNAELIVSGDEDLLILNHFQEIAIVTVRQFLEME
jgi:predicted nucleic acid-binding protein